MSASQQTMRPNPSEKKLSESNRSLAEANLFECA